MQHLDSGFNQFLTATGMLSYLDETTSIFIADLISNKYKALYSEMTITAVISNTRPTATKEEDKVVDVN